MDRPQDITTTLHTETDPASIPKSSVFSALLSELCVPVGQLGWSVVAQKGLQVRLDTARQGMQFVAALE